MNLFTDVPVSSRVARIVPVLRPPTGRFLQHAITHTP